MSLGEYIGAGSGTTKLLLHLNGNSTDSSGNGNNGTDTDITYSQANGRFGQGAGFNGSSSKILIGNSASIQLTTLTFGCWFKTSTPGASYRNLIQKSLAYTIGLKDGVLLSFDWSGSVDKSTGINCADGIWHNVLVTQVSGSANNFKIYLDGKLVYTNTYTSVNQSKNLILGSESGGTIEFYNGSIDEPFVENVIWTPQQVAKYYTYAKGRFGII